MLSQSEYEALDGLAMAALVKKGELTAVDLLQTAVARYEAVNPQLNAIVTPMIEQAATAVAQAIPAGAFQGVPFLMKDLGEFLAGGRMTSGCTVLNQFVPPFDSELVRRYRRAGLIIFGKTNTPEFGLLPTTESRLLGACRNPWDGTRSAGGSSGGAAAAVAAGIVPVAHGSDGGGSIRIPASCCGIFGLKPSRGRLPQGPGKGDTMSGLSTSHCLSRSVRDSAALLDATDAPYAGSPYAVPEKQRPFLTETQTPPGQLRIAYTTKPLLDTPIHPDVQQAIEATAQLCTDLGHQVIAAAPPIDGQQFSEAFITVWAAGCNWGIKSIEAVVGQSLPSPLFEPVTWGLHQKSAQQSPGDYLLAIQTLQQISIQMAQFFESYDLLLTPVTSTPPPPLGWFDSPDDNPMRGFERAIDYVPFTPVANATGQPAMSVPLFWNEAGLPIGAHFIGRFGDEATLFRLAAQLEAERPWAHKRPHIT